jgi:hypothetical protein
MSCMKTYRFRNMVGLGLLGLAVVACFVVPTVLRAGSEQTFDMLQIGATTYRNVTVTTKAKDYVFILHSTGMNNFRVSDLPGDVLEKLGYADPSKPVVKTNGPAVWAKETMAKLDTPQVEEVKAKALNALGPDPRAKIRELTSRITPVALGLALGVLVLWHLFFSYCCMLICQKTSGKPGVLVWIPGLQMIPLFRAAGMSGWWFLALLVPLVQLIPSLIWPFKIAKARSKGVLTAICLLLPVLNFFAFLYLAFSDGGGPAKRDERRLDIMTLEAA